MNFYPSASTIFKIAQIVTKGHLSEAKFSQFQESVVTLTVGCQLI